IGGDFERSASVPRPRPDDLGTGPGRTRRRPQPFAQTLPSSGGGQRPDRPSASAGPPPRRSRSPPMVLPLPFLPRRPTVPAKDGASWPHVVILGGGFAGAHAVEALRDARVRVTLIDRNVYKTFQPLLYQVATAGLNPGDVTMFLRGLSL